MKTSSPRAACAPPPDELPRARPGPMGRVASAPRPPNERRADERTVGRCGRARGGDPSALAPGSRRAAGRARTTGETTSRRGRGGGRRTRGGGGMDDCDEDGFPPRRVRPPPDELPRARPGPMGRLASARRPPNERRGGRTNGRTMRARPWGGPVGARSGVASRGRPAGTTGETTSRRGRGLRSHR